MARLRVKPNTVLLLGVPNASQWQGQKRRAHQDKGEQREKREQP